MSMMAQKDIQKKIRVLGKKHTWRIIANMQKSSKYIHQISAETNIPYTTVQHRVSELERAGLVCIIGQGDGARHKAGKGKQLQDNPDAG